MTFVTELINV